ncbi:MAG: fibronectin type III domain-containing protein [Anaerolineales bacterium]|nr:fibronectin type III domain-containing protein [Anaerolineales bacterium]
MTLDPESPVGIETVTFEVEFSRPMDVEVMPQVWFQSSTQITGNICSALDNALWVDETHFQASYDITALVARGEYRITVDGAFGTDRMEIALDDSTTFTVDYAGAVADTTPPAPPSVTACAGSEAVHLYANWSASDPDSAITLYQYAIGTTPVGAEVVNWTNTTETSFDRNDLGLTAGQVYYVSVRARNEGGLWSEPGTPLGLTAGSGVCATNSKFVYLPMVGK